MSISRTAMITIILSIFVIFAAAMGYITMADQDNDTTLSNSTRNAMTQAINKGTARVDEEVTINPEIATESLIRQYAETASFKDGGKTLNIYKLSSAPPLMAVESWDTVKTPVKGILQPFTKDYVPENTSVRQTEIYTYESKKLVKP